MAEAKGIPKKNGSGKGIGANKGRGGCETTKGNRECVSHWISELYNEHPEMSDKQIAAIAYKKCGLSKDDFKDGFCPYPILSRIKFIKGLENNLYTNDFSDLPTSIRIANAVNDNLFQLIEDFPNSDQLNILKMAYDMARGVLDNSDFETVKEEPVYFEIYVEDIDAFEEELKNQYQNDFTDDWEDDESVEFIEKFVKDHPNLYFRFDEGRLSEESFEEDAYNDLASTLDKAYEDLGKKEFEKQYPYKRDEEGNYKAQGVNALKGELVEENWMTRYKYDTLYAFEGEDLGENIAGDGVVVKPKKIIISFDLEDMGITINKYGQLDQIDEWENKNEIIKKVKKISKESKGDGRGWHGDSERHSRAKETGHADFTDDKTEAKFFAKDKPVTSSNVAEIGYERGKLRIFFKNGGGYEYPVPSSWYTEMLNAPSKGKYVWDSLRGKVPGRVIDNPSKTTPGGVGGSIVPYFKIKGAAMAPDTMRKSIKGFLKAAVKGKAEVAGEPIRKIAKPKFKAFIKFLEKKAGRFAKEEKPRVFKKITKKVGAVASKGIQKLAKLAKKAGRKIGKKVGIGRKEGPGKTEEPEEKEDKSVIKNQIKRLRKALKDAKKNKLDESITKSIENRIKQLEKSMSDFINYYNITDDFVDDMKHFKGPVTRAGDFEYSDGIKTKNFNNLKKIIKNYSHLPSFDSHRENQVLGFAYNLTTDPDLYMKDHPNYDELKKENYVYSEGYTFDHIESSTQVPLNSNTKFPVSLRFLDSNEGTDSNEQNITDLIHLAISTNRTEQDRCSSAGGNSCYVQFQDKQDFNTNLEQDEGVSMAKKEKKEKEEPPKEDKEEDEEDESKDSKKDEKKDKKDSKSDKMEEDFDSSKYMKILKSDFDELKQTKSDFGELAKEVNVLVKENKARNKAVAARDLKDIKDDFKDSKQLYTISSDFKKSADLVSMNVLKSALVPHIENVDAHSQMFSKDDYKSDLESIQEKLSKKFGMK